MDSRIEIYLGDITKLNVDAIVNAANKTLLGGGGVDGAIHNAAGPKLLLECKTIGGCKTGEAKITKGYNLPAKFVIHTVGPVWYGGKNHEDEKLTDCYLNSMKLAVKNNIKAIAFPAISTGAYSFPLERAAGIAVDSITKFLYDERLIEKVIFVCFNKETYDIYQRKLNLQKLS
jgi:O-acetyl-ADP-ribose deacetylase (regulator of RNase III)